MEFLFNLIFLLFLIGFCGDVSRDFYFNPVYKKIDFLLRPMYQFLARFFPAGNSAYSHLLLFSVFILLRALHYYAYRTEFYALKWGPSFLIWKDPSFLFALHKAFIATLLFYAQFAILFLLMDWVTRGMVLEPVWKLFRKLTEWPRRLLPVEGIALVIVAWGSLSLLFVLLLLPAWGMFAFVPGSEAPLGFIPKIFILNLYAALSIFQIYFFLFLIRAFLSWVMPYGFGGVGAFIYHLTEPVLTPFRQLNLQLGPIDLSLFLASIASLFLGQILASILARVNLLL